MEIYGFKTEEAQKAYDSVRFDIAAQLFKVNKWTYACEDSIKIPNERELRDFVRTLIKYCEDRFLEKGTPPEDDYYSASTGRWTVTYDDCDMYSIKLDFCNHAEFEDEDD